MLRNNLLHLKSLSLLLLVILLLSGCVSTGAKFKEEISQDNGKATVYIYRVKTFMTAGTSPDIVHNGQKVISNVSIGTYRVYHIEPGTHTFEPKNFGLFKKDNATIENSKPGETYYLRLTVNIGYIGLAKMAPVTALPEIRECLLVGGTKGSSSSSQPSSKNSAPTATASKPVPAKAESLKISPTPAPGPVKANNSKTSTNSISKASQSFLSVTATPAVSKIRILNIVPKFRQGIELTPGRYHIETSAQGYVTDKRWVSLQPGEQAVAIVLSSKHSTNTDTETKLMNLKAMYEKGLIKEDEYDVKRKQILAQM